MKSPRKSKDLDISVADLYAIRIKSIWREVRQQPISFWGLIAYFFFEYVRPQSIYPAIDILPWAQVTLLVTLIGAFTDRTVKWVANVENKLFMLFLFTIVLSSIFAFDPMESWYKKNLIINWVLVYFLVINIVNTEKRLFIFLLAYLLFSFKMSQHGFIVWADRGFSFAGWGITGPPGWFHNSGEYAIQMLIFGSLSTAFVLGLKEKWGSWEKLFFYLMPFTALMSVLGSSTRGAQLTLLVMGIVLLLKLKSGFKVIIFLIFFGMIAYFLLPDEQLQRFSSIGEDKNSLTRLAYWSYGIEVIQDHPILGVGYGNWTAYANFFVPEGIFSGRTQLPHNIFIEAGSELGLAGLFCFLLLVINVFVINARTRKLAMRMDNKLTYFLSYGLDFGLLGFLGAGFFVTVLYYPFFWVQMAMAVALNNITNKNALIASSIGEDAVSKDFIESPTR